jgi:hypothetical protein
MLMIESLIVNNSLKYFNFESVLWLAGGKRMK